MQKHYATKKVFPSSHRFRPGLIWVLASAVLLLLIVDVFLAFALNVPRAVTNSSLSKSISRQGDISTPTVATKQSSGTTPVAHLGSSNSHVGTRVHSGSSVSATPGVPALIASTPQSTQFGVFPLTTGGPLPIPETVLKPTNIARTKLDSTLISVYAGSMTRNPQVGILCVLREDLTTGQINQQVYQAPHPEGPLTILAIHNTTLTFADPKTQGSFNLSTGQFQ